MRRLIISTRSSSSRQAVPIHHSAIAFARGARTGVRRMRIPSLANTASKIAGEVAVAVLDQERELSRGPPRSIRSFRACWATQATAGVHGDSEEVDARDRLLHHE